MRNTKWSSITKTDKDVRIQQSLSELETENAGKFICGLHTNAVKVTFR